MTITAHDNYLYEDDQPVPASATRSWVFGPFQDEEGNDVSPTAITYTLTDRDGDVINSKEDTNILADLESDDTVPITLTGADLAVQTGETDILNERRILIEWTYNSDLGSGLFGKFTLIFWVRKIYPEA